MYELIDNLSPLTWILVIGLVILFILINKYLSSLRWETSGQPYKLRTYEDLNELIYPLGYAYDREQDTFTSIHDAWQRKMGYSRLFDEAAAPASMVIDCEPIYFEHGNKRWLIEFWKGQYGMTTGFEIGVYYTKSPDINLQMPKLRWYRAVSDEDMLDMSFILVKEGRVLMKRRDTHWWLTGFILGKFSNPDELMAYISIRLKDRSMRNQFILGLKDAGYGSKDIRVNNETVSIRFDTPKTKQPYTRSKRLDKITQSKNKLLCDKYEKMTAEYDNTLDKLIAIQRLDPALFEKLFIMGKPKQIFKDFDNSKSTKEWKI